MGLFVSGCGPGQLFGPVLTPTMTSTSTPTLTATPNPIEKALSDAQRLNKSGRYAEAISKYSDLLGETDDATVREKVFSELASIGKNLYAIGAKQEKESDSHEESDEACASFQLAYSAFLSIRVSSDRPEVPPSMEENFYIEAAKTEAAMVKCRLWYSEPRQSYREVVDALLKSLDDYPDVPIVIEQMTPAIVSVFGDMSKDALSGIKNTSVEDVKRIGDEIIDRVGEYVVDGKKMREIVNAKYAEVSICGKVDMPYSDVAVGNSNNKRVESCPYFGNNYLIDEADLRAKDLGEVWFVLEENSHHEKDLECKGYLSNTGQSFRYSYEGQDIRIYTLRDAKTGATVSVRKLYGTAPRCVFTKCTLNKTTMYATCTGGQGTSASDSNAVIQWLRSVILNAY
jgi:hypothetical protein